MKIETDQVEIRASVRHGFTMGGRSPPLVANRDYKNWDERMNPWPIEARSRRSPCRSPVTPTWSGCGSTNTMTSGRSSNGPAPARRLPGPPAGSPGLLTAVGVTVRSHVTQIGFGRPERDDLKIDDFEGSTTIRFVASTPKPRRDGRGRSTSCGRRTKASAAPSRCVFSRPVPGLGGHISWGPPRRPPRPGDLLDPVDQGRFDRPGLGRRRPGFGSAAHDEIFHSEERGYYRETNHAGGLEGGMTNGMPLSVRSRVKPISTMTKPLRRLIQPPRNRPRPTSERTDSAVPAAAVVGEAMICLAPGQDLPREVRRRPHG